LYIDQLVIVSIIAYSKNINPIVKATSEDTPPIDSVSIPDLIHGFFTILPLIPIKKKRNCSKYARNYKCMI
jgi:hypothetical protein